MYVFTDLTSLARFSTSNRDMGDKSSFTVLWCFGGGRSVFGSPPFCIIENSFTAPGRVGVECKFPTFGSGDAAIFFDLRVVAVVLSKALVWMTLEPLRAAETVFFVEDLSAGDPLQNFPAIGVNFRDLFALVEYLDAPDFLTGVLYLEAVVFISINSVSSKWPLFFGLGGVRQLCFISWSVSEIVGSYIVLLIILYFSLFYLS